MMKRFIFILGLFCCTAAHGLTLKVAQPGVDTPLEIALHATKRTERALAVKTTGGTIYYADMMPVANSFPGGMFARIDSQIYQIGPTPKFFVTTTPGTKSFSFSISAAGSFIVDWGDGAVQEIMRTDTNAATYSHTYSTAGKYTIGIGGQVTEYNGSCNSFETATISFKDNMNIAGIDGSLGAVFSAIGDGSLQKRQVCFKGTFSGCENLKSHIPENLFSGVSGYLNGHIFAQTFLNSGVTGTIPEKLFGAGRITNTAFYYTFSGCSGLTGSIPKNLFANVSGKTESGLFEGTFDGCSGLTGPIPEKLFANFSGNIEGYLFKATFAGCSGLTGSIPDNLFGDISGPLTKNAFYRTFEGCAGLTGSSAKINGKYLYEIWPDATYEQVGGCYRGTTGLSDYVNIPAAWK